MPSILCLMDIHQPSPWVTHPRHPNDPTHPQSQPRSRYCRRCYQAQRGSRSVEPPFRTRRRRWGQ